MCAPHRQVCVNAQLGVRDPVHLGRQRLECKRRFSEPALFDQHQPQVPAHLALARDVSVRFEHGARLFEVFVSPVRLHHLDVELTQRTDGTRPLDGPERRSACAQGLETLDRQLHGFFARGILRLAIVGHLAQRERFHVSGTRFIERVGFGQLCERRRGALSFRARFTPVDAEDVKHARLDETRLRRERAIPIRTFKTIDCTLNRGETQLVGCVSPVGCVRGSRPGAERRELRLELRIFDGTRGVLPHAQMNLAGLGCVLRTFEHHAHARSLGNVLQCELDARASQVVFHFDGLWRTFTNRGEAELHVREVLVDDRDQDGVVLDSDLAVRQVDKPVGLAR